MEQRKLIKLGNSSFAIALPKEWVDKAGLKKGDEIFIERNSNGELIVMPNEKSGKEEKSIQISLENKNEQEIKRELRAAYIQGNGSIRFHGRNKESQAIVKNLIKDLIGLEVSREEGEEFEVRDFFDLREANHKNFVRRMDNNTREMFEILIESLRRGKLSKKETKDIEEIDKDTNKIYFLNSRITFRGMDNPSIQSTLKLSPTQLFNNWWQAFHLEQLGDIIKGAAKKIQEAEFDEKNIRSIVETAENVRECYNLSMDSFYKNDKVLAKKSLDKIPGINRQLDELRKIKHDDLKAIVLDIERAIKTIYQNSKITLYLENYNGV